MCNECLASRGDFGRTCSSWYSGVSFLPSSPEVNFGSVRQSQWIKWLRGLAHPWAYVYDCCKLLEVVIFFLLVPHSSLSNILPVAPWWLTSGPASPHGTAPTMWGRPTYSTTSCFHRFRIFISSSCSFHRLFFWLFRTNARNYIFACRNSVNPPSCNPYKRLVPSSTISFSILFFLPPRSFNLEPVIVRAMIQTLRAVTNNEGWSFQDLWWCQ